MSQTAPLVTPPSPNSSTGQAIVATTAKRRKASQKDEAFIRRTVKLKLTKAQTAELERWLVELTKIFNFALLTIEYDAKKGKYYKQLEFQNLLTGRYDEFGMPAHVIQAMLGQAYDAWSRCFKKVSKKPRRKDAKNRLRSISFPDKTKIPSPGILQLLGFADRNRISPRAQIIYKQQHAQAKHDPKRGDMIDAIPKDLLRGARIIKKASGWYASILVAMPPAEIPVTGYGRIGIDPGFMTLLTTSTGEKIEHPKELQKGAERLAQAQRGGKKHLTARLHERMANKRLDRNHKASRKLLSENELIVMSKDNLLGLAKSGFGKSVASAGLGDLRKMLSTKRRAGKGGSYVEVSGRNSTLTCCVCKGRFGPRGKVGLKVRFWVCTGCGTLHDRDVCAAVNTHLVGDGQSPEQEAVIVAAYLKYASQFLSPGRFAPGRSALPTFPGVRTPPGPTLNGYSANLSILGLVSLFLKQHT